MKNHTNYWFGTNNQKSYSASWRQQRRGGAVLLKNIGNKDDPNCWMGNAIPWANRSFWTPVRMGVIVNVTWSKFHQSNDKDMYVSYTTKSILKGMYYLLVRSNKKKKQVFTDSHITYMISSNWYRKGCFKYFWQKWHRFWETEWNNTFYYAW